jgi:THO complex subunit 3
MALAQQAGPTKDNASRYFSHHKSTVFRYPYTHGLVVRKVKWNNVGSRFATIHNDRHIRVWPSDKPEPKSSVEIRGAHERGVEDISWCPLHSEYLVSCSTDGTVKLWDTRTRQCLAQKDVGECLVLAYSSDGKYIAVGLKNDMVKILKADDLEEITSYQETEEVYNIAWSSSSELFAVSLGNGNIRIVLFDGKTTSIFHTLKGHRTAATCLEFDPMGNFLAVGSNEGIVSIWDLRDWICLKTFTKADQPVTSLSYSHEGSYIAVASDNSLPIEIIHVESGDYIHSVKQKFDGRPCVQFHPLKFTLLFSGDAQGVTLLSTGK